MSCGASSEHDADHGEPDEGCGDAGVALVVAAEAAVAADPAERALDDPALGQHDEAADISALDDLQVPRARPRDQRPHLGAGIAAVGDNALDEREAPPRLSQQCLGAVAVLDVGGVHVDVQEEALRVDEDVALAPDDLLAGIVARAVERRPPFSAPLALCASRIAMVGLASRPARSRVST